MQIVVGRTDRRTRSSERIVAPGVLIPAAIVSIQLLVEMRIVHVELVGANSHNRT